MKRFTEVINQIWVQRGIFFVFSFALLAFLNYDVLYQLFWKNYFLFNSVFYSQTMGQTAGLLIYCARFLNQLFRWPVIAAFVISALLTGLELLLSYLFDRKNEYRIFCFLPSFLLLHELTTVAYALYSKLEISYFFAPLVGTFVALLLYFAYRKVKAYPWGVYCMMGASLLLSPILGFYSLVAGFLMAVNEFADGRKLLLLGQTILTLIGVTICSKLLYDERWMHALLAPLPDVSFSELLVPVLLSVAGIFLLLCKKHLKKMKNVYAMIAFFVAMALLVGWNFTDSHATFRKEMCLSRLCDEQDWDGILEKIDERENITHTMNAYRVMALSYKKELPQQLFRQKMPFKESPSDYSSEIAIYYPDLFFHASHLSSALALNFEQWVTFGETYKALKQFALLALMKGENELATRYINIMKGASALRTLASELEPCVGNLQLLFEKFPYCADIMKNQMKQDIFLSPRTDFAKTYLLFTQVDGINVERRLYARLFLGEIDEVIRDVMVARQQIRYFPPCVQEAFVLKCISSKNNDLMRVIPIDRNLAQRVQSFIQTYYQFNAKDVKQAGEKLFESYGDLYSYYYFINFVSK